MTITHPALRHNPTEALGVDRAVNDLLSKVIKADV